jgi:formylglycine-generating enzyme required for sulfatase activity
MQLFLYIITILLFFSSLPEIYAEEILLDIVNAGIKNYDLKIKTVRFDGVFDNVLNGIKGRTEYTLAYEEHKEFLDQYRIQTADTKTGKLKDEAETLEYVFDGERTWWINRHYWWTNYLVITGRNFLADFDPRFYTSRSRNDYDKRTLDEYLAENNAEVTGEETFEIKQNNKIIKEPCYVVSFENKDDERINKFWISKNAFRLMKYESKKNNINGVNIYRFSIIYKQFSDDTWYPEYIEYDLSDYPIDGSRHPVNVGKIVLSNIEINTDISRFFKFNVALDAMIFDFDTSKQYLANTVSDKIAVQNPDAVKTMNRGRDSDNDMALIPAGKFKMGDECKEVYVAGFYMDKYEVTNKEFAEFLNVMGRNQDEQGHLFLRLDPPYCKIELIDSMYQAKPGYEDHPVLQVTQYGAMAYAKWKGKRLPKEVEWEKAARGGLIGKEYPWGDTISHSNANYEGTDVPDIWLGTAPVGSFPPNRYGLYDMAGNASERCSDLYNNDPDLRIIRGGAWENERAFLRCASRYGTGLDKLDNNVGFRCAKDAGKTADNK